MTPESTDNNATTTTPPPGRGDVQPAAPASSTRREALFSRPRWSWNIIAIVCLVAATISLLNSYTDAAFVTATLGVVALFLEVRNKYKVARIESQDSEDDAESEFEEDRDEH